MCKDTVAPGPPVLVLIGERPGLSVANSLGIYLPHRPRPECTDADRNCISNIHPPDGLGYRQAARVVVARSKGHARSGSPGVELKDTSRTASVGPGGGSVARLTVPAWSGQNQRSRTCATASS